jgi:putative exosortase-associated protein (TIGR04073 family)
MRFDSEAMPRIQLARKQLGRLRIHRALVLASIVLSLLGPAAAAAKDGPARKLGRGFANLGLGVLAIPGQVIETTRESGPALGVTWGIVKGTAVMLATEVVGLFEVVTCPFATPPGYGPILEPEFPWQHFSESESQSDVRKVRSATRAGR